MDHLVHCLVVYNIWNLLSFSSQYAVVLSISFSLISRWWIRNMAGLPIVIWSYLPRTLCWGMWKERNKEILRERSHHRKLVIA